MRRALTAAAAAAVTNEAPDLSSTALWTARGRVLLCLPLLYDSPVSTFVAHVGGMDRSSDQVTSWLPAGLGPHEPQAAQELEKHSPATGRRGYKPGLAGLGP